MIVYSKTKREFLDDCLNDRIENEINNKVLSELNRHTAESEFNSWRNSMQYMYKVLTNETIPNECDILIEYRIPYASSRIDFMICGEDENKHESIIIIEIKQWNMVKKVDGKEAMVKTILNKGYHEHVHPSYQAWSYASMIEDYNEGVRDNNIELMPCAYLHNYILSEDNDDLTDSSYKYYLDKAPVFVRGDAPKLASFISKYIKRPNKEVLYHIENGRISPSKSLQDNIASMLKGNKEFILIDEQKEVFEKALDIVNKDYRFLKQVYIIHGGPGTGKSVLAINLLSKILNKSKNTMYITKNNTPRSVYAKKLKSSDFRSTTIDHLFKGSGCFTSSKSNEFDCLIVDEAHRLNEKSGMFQNIGENQVKEIINAAKTSIFFVDDNQIVTIKDIGNTKEIKKWARFYNAEIYEDTLKTQFRCNGSDAYLSWLDYILDIDLNYVNNDIFEYDFKVFDSPNEVMNIIKEKNKINNKSRMLAGYCWDWIKEGKTNTDIHDINIDNFHASWNLSNTSTWAIDENSVNEIGCIHTSQGLEFDYVGVIIGADLRYENGLVTDFTKRAKTDQSMKGIKSIYKKNKQKAFNISDRIIKNTYRTLMTRGQKGCYIYCVDKGLRDYFINELNKLKK